MLKSLLRVLGELLREAWRRVAFEEHPTELTELTELMAAAERHTY